jgi:D-Tyr-tRNAtyr deacylase
VENVVGENLAKRGKKRLQEVRAVFAEETKKVKGEKGISLRVLIKVKKQDKERQCIYIGERINGKKIFEELKRFENAK